MKEKKFSRREFIVRAAGSCAACVLTPFLLAGGESKPTGGEVPGNVSKTATFDLDEPAYAPLKDTGGAVYGTIEGEKETVIIHRVSESEVAVFSSRCTHAGCKVELPKNGQVVCKCHNSSFDGTGRRLRGPATRDLKRFDAVVRGNSIVVSIS